jgi:hypothetical protein
MPKYHHYAIALALATLISAPLSAERLSIKPADIRDTWSYPSGALIINDRTLHPWSLRKAINPLTDATVRGVGAAQAQPPIPSTAAARQAGARLHRTRNRGGSR